MLWWGGLEVGIIEMQNVYKMNNYHNQVCDESIIFLVEDIGVKREGVCYKVN